MNRTRGFVNLNRFKWGKTIKKLVKTTDVWHRVEIGAKKQWSRK